ncbi:MAG: MFS transporter, partial [Chloroflexi bacterium]|nr:MFS transporter [Chloroflexota bacterium]
FLADRVGARVVTAFAMFMGGAGFIILGQVREPWHFYVAFVFLGTMGGMSLVLVSTAVSNWFVRMRGRALGLTFVGPGFGGLLTVLLVVLIEAYGWRTAAVLTGFGTWMIGIPLSLLLRRSPEAYGLRPDGDNQDSSAVEPTVAMAAAGTLGPALESLLTARQVVRTSSYWLYVAALLGQQAAISAFVVHHIPALVSYGFSFRAAGFLVLVFTIASIPMRFLGGYFADRYDRRLVFAGLLGCQLVGSVLFVFINGLWTAVVFEVIYGTGWGGSNPARLSLQAEYWGRNIFGALMGIQIGAAAVGGLFAPVLVGWLSDATNSYRIAFAAPILPLALATFLVLLLKPPRRPVPLLGDSAVPR